MDFISFVRALVRNKYVLIFVPLTTLAAVFYITSNLPLTFKSKAQMATGITESSQVSLNEQESLQPFMIANAFSNLIESMKGRPIVSLVSYKLILHDLYDEKPFRNIDEPSTENSKKVLQSAGFGHRTNADPVMPSALTVQNNAQVQKLLEIYHYDFESLSKKLKIERVGGSDFLSIEFESENPELSAFVVNTVCAEFIRTNKNYRAVQSQSNVDFFARLADRKKGELDNKVNSLKSFKLQNQVINLYEQTKALVDQISSQEGKLEDEKKKIPALKKVLADINGRFTNKDRLFFESQAGILNRKISFLKDRINAMNGRYLDSRQQDTALLDSIKVVRRIMDEQVRLMSETFFINPTATKQDLIVRKVNSELDLQMAYGASESIEQELRRLRAIVASYAPMEASIGAYEREIQVASEVYLLILNKLNSAQFAGMNLGGSLRQVEYATPADKPEPSKRAIILALSAIISLVLCIVVIFILEYMDNNIKTPMRFKRLTNMHLLGYFNALTASNIDLNNLFRSGDDNFEDQTFSQLCRNFRHRFELDTIGKKVVLFVSPKGGEGKTFTIATLTYSLQMIGKKILIIDTNFSSPRLTEVYKATSSLNTINNDNFRKAIVHTQIEGVDIIGASRSPMSPVEIFAGKDFQKILNDLSQDYDYIFMESGQLSNAPSARELMRYADTVVSVYAADTILTNADISANNMLRGLQDKFAGALLNRVDMYNMESELGEVKKKRSIARRFLKRLLFRKEAPSHKERKLTV
ncbi:MAG: AAA family ATPase [Bacteroidota bacterium]